MNNASSKGEPSVYRSVPLGACGRAGNYLQNKLGIKEHFPSSLTGTQITLPCSRIVLFSKRFYYYISNPNLISSLRLFHTRHSTLQFVATENNNSRLTLWDGISSAWSKQSMVTKTFDDTSNWLTYLHTVCVLLVYVHVHTVMRIVSLKETHPRVG